LVGKLQKWLSAKQKAKSADCAFIKVRQLKQKLFALLRVTEHFVIPERRIKDTKFPFQLFFL